MTVAVESSLANGHIGDVNSLLVHRALAAEADSVAMARQGDVAVVRKSFKGLSWGVPG